MSHDRFEVLLLDDLYDELAPGDREALAAHLAGCPRCREERAALARTLAATRTLDPGPGPAGDVSALLAAAGAEAARLRAARPGPWARLVEAVGRLALRPAAVAAGVVAVTTAGMTWLFVDRPGRDAGQLDAWPPAPRAVELREEAAPPNAPAPAVGAAPATAAEGLAREAAAAPATAAEGLAPEAAASHGVAAEPAASERVAPATVASDRVAPELAGSTSAAREPEAPTRRGRAEAASAEGGAPGKAGSPDGGERREAASSAGGARAMAGPAGGGEREKVPSIEAESRAALASTGSPVRGQAVGAVAPAVPVPGRPDEARVDSLRETSRAAVADSAGKPAPASSVVADAGAHDGPAAAPPPPVVARVDGLPLNQAPFLPAPAPGSAGDAREADGRFAAESSDDEIETEAVLSSVESRRTEPLPKPVAARKAAVAPREAGPAIAAHAADAAAAGAAATEAERLFASAERARIAARFDEAISIYLRLADGHPAHPRAPEALLAAARLRKEGGDLAGARRLVARLEAGYAGTTAAADARRLLPDAP